MQETHKVTLLPPWVPSPCSEAWWGWRCSFLWVLYLLWMSNIFEHFLKYISHPPSPKWKPELHWFSVSLALTGGPWPRLMIRHTTHRRHGFGRKSVDEKVLSATCFLVSVVGHSRHALSLWRSWAHTAHACALWQVGPLSYTFWWNIVQIVPDAASEPGSLSILEIPWTV